MNEGMNEGTKEGRKEEGRKEGLEGINKRRKQTNEDKKNKQTTK